MNNKYCRQKKIGGGEPKMALEHRNRRHHKTGWIFLDFFLFHPWRFDGKNNPDQNGVSLAICVCVCDLVGWFLFGQVQVIPSPSY